MSGGGETKIQDDGITNLIIKLAEHGNNPIEPHEPPACLQILYTTRIGRHI